MQDTSSIGVMVLLKASKTFPNGIAFRAYPEDGDVGSTGNNEITGNGFRYKRRFNYMVYCKRHRV